MRDTNLSRTTTQRALAPPHTVRPMSRPAIWRRHSNDLRLITPTLPTRLRKLRAHFLPSGRCGWEEGVCRLQGREAPSTSLEISEGEGHRDQDELVLRGQVPSQCKFTFKDHNLQEVSHTGNRLSLGESCSSSETTAVAESDRSGG